MKILQLLFEFLQKLWQQIQPPQPFSWQTLFLLSLFSWAVSLVILNPTASSFVAQMGWIFLTLGMGWATKDYRFTIPLIQYKVYPGPWITAALVSFLLYYWDHASLSFSLTILPMTAAIVSTISKFLSPGFTLRKPGISDRQSLTILYLFHAIMSCWIAFHFLVQDWIREYPSLLTDDFSRSAFVVDWGVRINLDRFRRSNSFELLEIADVRLQRQIESLSWAETERWLLNDRQQFELFANQVMLDFQNTAGDALDRGFWKLSVPSTDELEPGEKYTLTLRANWTGPGSSPRGYYVDKQCTIAQSGSIEFTPPQINERFNPLESLFESPIEQAPAIDRTNAVTVNCEPAGEVKYL